jgi:hypothetical protein
VLNPPGEIAGYKPYPESWPRLGAPALIHFGAIPALVGQLEFDFPLGRATMVAVPLTETCRPRSSRDRALCSRSSFMRRSINFNALRLAT